MSKDYYNILGVSKNATQEEIKKAYRRLAHEFHPDKQGGNEEKFKEINTAYQTLKDPEKRRQYDQYGTTFEQARAKGGFGGFHGFSDFADFAQTSGFGDLNDIFADFFGWGRGAKRAKPAGKDIAVDLTIDFSEAIFGAKKEIELFKPILCRDCGGNGAERSAGQKTCASCGGSGQRLGQRQTFFGTFQSVHTCDQCKGRGQIPEKLCKACGGSGTLREKQIIEVKVPSGIEDDNTLRLTSQGEAAAGGGVSGDLYVTIHIRKHPKFERDGETIHSEEEISLTDSLLGSKIDVATVDGGVEMQIPEGTKHGDIFRLRGKGAPTLNGARRGDHLVTINVRIPKKISRMQKKIIENLRESGL